jgi:bifunctional non-homologous end joining protein LigD
MGLREYRRKRDFTRTPEPAGAPRHAPGRLFVVQKHAARRLHYDFRLELDGVLKSWAIPRGPSLDPHEKRLAVHVEDHPVEYGDFEGVIPEGEYGGGTVMLWDRGSWEPIGDPEEGYAKGHLKFRLDGEKLHGGWALVRIKSRGRGGRRPDTADNWLLIKESDEVAQPGSGDAVTTQDKSVATRRDLAAIARERRRVWRSGNGEEQQPEPAPAAPVPNLDKIADARRATPVPDVAPQLATLARAAPAGEQWLHEIKYDGYRILAKKDRGETVLLSRNGLDWTGKFPEIAAAVDALPARQALLDGEVVAGDGSRPTSFGALQQALSEQDTARLGYMVFDLLFLDGWDLRGAALEQRKAVLAALLHGVAPPIQYSDHQAGRGPEFLAVACAHRLEGIVSKRRDQPYRSGRGGGWIKSKCIGREELVIVGFTDPAGARSGFGVLLVGYYDRAGRLVYAGKVGTGYSTEMLQQLRRRLDAIATRDPPVQLPKGVSQRGLHWVRPELVGEFGFAEWTTDGVLRQPRFLGLREDKKAADVVLQPLGPAAAPAPRPAPAAKGAALVGGVEITHADRVLYPQQSLTKRQVAEYYAAVAPFMLPYIARRPLSLMRCPEGLAADCFFQKHFASGVPDSVRPVEILERGAPRIYRWVEDDAGLLGLANLGVLEFHPWGSTVDHLEKPDILIFDLDPDEGLPWQRVVDAALTLRGLFHELGLESFAKVTGGKGLHVVLPIRPTLDWDTAKGFSRAVVHLLVEQMPFLYTASMVKKARAGRIFIDYLRNGRGATAVAAYSTRARQSATVAMPVSWDEVEAGIAPDRFTIENTPRWLAARRADPWADFLSTKQTLTAAARRRVGG